MMNEFSGAGTGGLFESQADVNALWTEKFLFAS